MRCLSNKLALVVLAVVILAGNAYAADTAISGLTADATPTSDDLIATVNDPGGTPATRKATLANAMKVLNAAVSGVAIHSDNLGTVAAGKLPAITSATALTWDLSSFTLTLPAVTGALDFGGATSLEIPNSDDPNVDAAGEVSWDTDGWMRAFDGTNQVAIARKQEEIHVTVVKPQDMADAVRDAFLVWSNESGMSFVITGWKGWSGTDDTTLNIETTAADGQTNATVDAVELATNGTGVFTGADTTITAATIANGSLLWLDFDDTDDPSYVKMVIYGYYNGDVN